ncbi:MobF family relaxase [Streptomyces capparidis]
MAWRATVLGRPPGEIYRPLLVLDLVFRPPSTLQVLWALGDEATREVREECHTRARGAALAWLGDEAAEVCWGRNGRHRAPVLGGLSVAVSRHHTNRDGAPLLDDHALVSVKVRRPDGTWGNLDSAVVYRHVVAAGTLYTLRLMEEVSERLGVAWEPRQVTEGLRPVVEIAGIPPETIAWQGTRRHRIKAAYQDLAARYETEHGHPPGGRTRHRFSRWAAQATRPAKATPEPLPELRAVAGLRGPGLRRRARGRPAGPRPRCGRCRVGPRPADRGRGFGGGGRCRHRLRDARGLHPSAPARRGPPPPRPDPPRPTPRPRPR